jgi:hypothetical protein
MAIRVRSSQSNQGEKLSEKRVIGREPGGEIRVIEGEAVRAIRVIE